MKIKLSLSKDVNSNANKYFDKSKKLKSKIPGIDKIIEKTKNEISEFNSKRDEYLEKKEKEALINVHKKKEWYEKFRFTFTSGGFLCVLGKDSGTNEVLLKKHMENNDIVLHTELAGSPFCLIKGGRDKISKGEIEEAATFVACFSKQWKRGFGAADAFWVYPEQVSKKANTGEYISKGSFMIRGTKNILKNLNLRICLGVRKVMVKTEDSEVEIDELFSGSQRACEVYCKNRYIKLEPGNSNYKAMTKEIKKRLKTHIEDLPKYIPNDSKILKK